MAPGRSFLSVSAPHAPGLPPSSCVSSLRSCLHGSSGRAHAQPPLPKPGLEPLGHGAVCCGVGWSGSKQRGGLTHPWRARRAPQSLQLLAGPFSASTRVSHTAWSCSSCVHHLQMLENPAASICAQRERLFMHASASPGQSVSGLAHGPGGVAKSQRDFIPHTAILSMPACPFAPPFMVPRWLPQPQ